MIWDSAEIERVIWEYRKNPAVICEFCIGCDDLLSLDLALNPSEDLTLTPGAQP